MKSLNDAMQYDFKCLDGRDIIRFSQFLSVEQIKKIGLEFDSPEKEKEWKPKKWNRKNILKQLKSDVQFGFEKALNKRGISSALMYECVRFWNWVLEDNLENLGEDMYAQYGLPYFKATAIKYGFDNPIKDCQGNEFKFSAEYDVYEGEK